VCFGITCIRLFVIYNFSPIVVVTHAETGKHRGGTIRSRISPHEEEQSEREVQAKAKKAAERAISRIIEGKKRHGRHGKRKSE
jgi:hypothetical protein